MALKKIIMCLTEMELDKDFLSCHLTGSKAYDNLMDPKKELEKTKL